MAVTKELHRWHVIRRAATATRPATAYVVVGGREHRGWRTYTISERRTVALPPGNRVWTDAEIVAGILQMDAEARWTCGAFPDIKKAMRHRSIFAAQPASSVVLPDDPDDVERMPAISDGASLVPPRPPVWQSPPRTYFPQAVPQPTASRPRFLPPPSRAYPEAAQWQTDLQREQAQAKAAADAEHAEAMAHLSPIARRLHRRPVALAGIAATLLAFVLTAATGVPFALLALLLLLVDAHNVLTLHNWLPLRQWWVYDRALFILGALFLWPLALLCSPFVYFGQCYALAPAVEHAERERTRAAIARLEAELGRTTPHLEDSAASSVASTDGGDDEETTRASRNAP